MKICHTCQQTYSDDVEFCPHDGARLAAQATETEAQLAAGLSRRFRIVRRLGKGGMGTVFLAEQIGVGNRPVALKVLNRKLLDDPDFLLRFQNEAGSTGRIHHPNVVTIYESAQSDDGTPYIGMEFLEGQSLREVIKQRGTLPLPEVAEILQQAAGGLNAAHKLGIIHRDLKPDNLFLTRGDQGELIVKVLDFGIAKLRESATHTMTGTVLGTPAYMSYEQASGMRSDELDARSDIYSLGVVVYEMFTGRTPFHSDTPVGYLRKHLMEEPPPFHAVEPGLIVPPRIESLVMKALTKDRNQRYGSVLEFAQEFAQAADAGSHLAAQAEPQREAPKPQPQTTVTPVPKTIVSAAVRDTAVAKAVPETARPPRRKWLGSRWKRIGIIASLVWVLGTGIFTLCLGRLTTGELVAQAIVAFAPVLLGWGLIYLVLFLVRWISRPPPATRAPQVHPISQPPRKMKFIGIAGVALVVIVAGTWYFLHRRPKGLNPDGSIKKGDVSWCAKAGTSKGEVRVNPNGGLKYVWVPPGTYVMGCSPGDTECDDKEKPPHEVTITKGFWMGQTEVTVGAYKRFVAATGRAMPSAPEFNPGWGNEQMPIVDVSWNDALDYCTWAGGRLPTEAEWEYAARGGSTASRYGDVDEIAWYADNSGRERLDSAGIWKEDRYNYFKRLYENGNGLHEVGQKRPNDFGLYDMLGNAWEWVTDWNDDEYYQNSPYQDPTGPTSGTHRVVRGGSTKDVPWKVRVSDRSMFYPPMGSMDGGFRCVGEVFAPSSNPHAPQLETPLRGGASSAQDKAARTARDYYDELKAANNFNHYKDTYVCFRDDDVPSFSIIGRGSDVIEEMKKAGAVPAKVVLQAKDLLFVETYYKGVSNKTEVFNPVGKDGTDWDIEFNAPIHHGRMLYSIDWATGRYRLSVYALDHSKTIPAAQTFGKCEVIHPEN